MWSVYMTRKSSCRHLLAQARRQNSGVGVHVSLIDHLVGGLLKAHIFVTAIAASIVVPGTFATASIENTRVPDRNELIEAEHHGLSHAHCLTKIDRKQMPRLMGPLLPRAKYSPRNGLPPLTHDEASGENKRARSNGEAEFLNSTLRRIF
jgi:hypothetical protein